MKRNLRPVVGGMFAAILTLCAVNAWAQDETVKPPLPEPKDAAVRDRERQAMIEFYNAMGGPDWKLINR